MQFDRLERSTVHKRRFGYRSNAFGHRYRRYRFTAVECRSSYRGKRSGQYRLVAHAVGEGARAYRSNVCKVELVQFDAVDEALFRYGGNRLRQSHGRKRRTIIEYGTAEARNRGRYDERGHRRHSHEATVAYRGYLAREFGSYDFIHSVEGICVEFRDARAHLERSSRRTAVEGVSSERGHGIGHRDGQESFEIAESALSYRDEPFAHIYGNYRRTVAESFFPYRSHVLRKRHARERSTAVIRALAYRRGAARVEIFKRGTAVAKLIGYGGKLRRKLKIFYGRAAAESFRADIDDAVGKLDRLERRAILERARAERIVTRRYGHFGEIGIAFEKSFRDRSYLHAVQFVGESEHGDFFALLRYAVQNASAVREIDRGIHFRPLGVNRQIAFYFVGLRELDGIALVEEPAVEIVIRSFGSARQCKSLAFRYFKRADGAAAHRIESNGERARFRNGYGKPVGVHRHVGYDRGGRSERLSPDVVVEVPCVEIISVFDGICGKRRNGLAGLNGHAFIRSAVHYESYRISVGIASRYKRRYQKKKGYDQKR